MECMLCGSEQSQIFERVESFGFPLVYYQCETCGLIFQSPHTSPSADPDFYAETYRRIYQSSEEPTPKDIWVQEQRAAHLVRFLRAQDIQAPKRILDVGASAGILLETFRGAFDADVVGVEPGDVYRAHAEKRGLQMLPSLKALIATQPERFDLVCLLHVLEHLPDPIGTLKSIREKLLSENGWLLLEVPNFYAHDSYELAHLACYTPHTLQEMIKQAGYQVQVVESHGVPRSELLKLYLTALARPITVEEPVPSIHPERFVRQKRQIALFYRRIIQKCFPRDAWLPLPDENEV